MVVGCMYLLSLPELHTILALKVVTAETLRCGGQFHCELRYTQQGFGNVVWYNKNSTPEMQVGHMSIHTHPLQNNASGKANGGGTQ